MSGESESYTSTNLRSHCTLLHQAGQLGGGGGEHAAGHLDLQPLPALAAGTPRPGEGHPGQGPPRIPHGDRFIRFKSADAVSL